jgi:hypothetical protein
MRALLWLLAIIAMASAYDSGEDDAYSTTSGLTLPPAPNTPVIVNTSARELALPVSTPLPPPPAEPQKPDAPDHASAVMSLATALTNARPGRKTNDPQRSATRTEIPRLAKLFHSALAHVNVVLAGQHTVTMKDVWTEMAKTEELEQLEPDDHVMEATAGANIIKFLADPRKGRGANAHLSGIVSKGVNTKQFASAIGQSESFVRAARIKAASAFPDNGPWATSLLTMNMAPYVLRAKIGEIEIVSSLFAIHIITLIAGFERKTNTCLLTLGRSSVLVYGPKSSKIR